MTISSDDCKKAIVDWVKARPGHVAKQFCDIDRNAIQAFEAPSLLEKNWKRMSKFTDGNGITERIFDCRPYDDQLRGYVYDNGATILSVDVHGE
jgi:hypothetical protein